MSDNRKITESEMWRRMDVALERIPSMLNIYMPEFKEPEPSQHQFGKDRLFELLMFYLESVEKCLPVLAQRIPDTEFDLFVGYLIDCAKGIGLYEMHRQKTESLMALKNVVEKMKNYSKGKDQQNED